MFASHADYHCFSVLCKGAHAQFLSSAKGNQDR